MIQTTPTLSWTCNCPSKESVWIAIRNTLWAFWKGGTRVQGGWMPRSPPWSPEHTHALICNHVHAWRAIILSLDVMEGVERWCNICFLENAQTLWPCPCRCPLWNRWVVSCPPVTEDACTGWHSAEGYCMLVSALWRSWLLCVVCKDKHGCFLHAFLHSTLYWTLGGNWRR